MKLYSKGSEYYYSETTFFGKMNFNFYASNNTGYPTLNIYSTSSSYTDGCDFTMYSKTAPTPTPTPTPSPGTNGNANGIVFWIIIVFVFAACGGAKKYQMRQASVIIAQNLTQQPTVVTTYSSQQPASIINVNQGFVQPQPTYIAPNQFPNGQVQFAGNVGFPNAQVQFAGNPQFPNGQVQFGANPQFPNAQVNMNFAPNNGQQGF
jgi:hypothetical protein